MVYRYVGPIVLKRLSSDYETRSKFRYVQISDNFKSSFFKTLLVSVSDLTVCDVNVYMGVKMKKIIV